MNNGVTLIHRLCDELPFIAPQLETHLADNYGQLLPYVFLGEIAMWSETAVDSNRGDVIRLLQVLEGVQESGSAEQRNLIGAGFLENLDAASPIVPLLPAGLQKSWRRMWG